MISAGQFHELDHSRSPEQTMRMETAEEIGECTFCPENIQNLHQGTIYYQRLTGIELVNTYFTTNDFPHEGYGGLKTNEAKELDIRVLLGVDSSHILAIPNKHYVRLEDIDSATFTELIAIACDIESYYGPGYTTIGTRSGGSKINESQHTTRA